MDYCATADVTVYVPQAPAAETFATEITEVSGIIDAHLRGHFTVPLYAGVTGDIEQYVKTMAAKLAAGKYLRAKMSRKSREPHPYAERLLEEGMEMLEAVKADKTMIDSEIVQPGEIEDEERAVVVANEDVAPVFGMGDERTWG